MDQERPVVRTRSVVPRLVLLVPLAVGLVIAALIPQPVVGILNLNDAIANYTAGEMLAQLEYVREHSEVRAVVLVMDSPGGTVVDTEAVYQELLRVRRQLPVVTYVQGMAASGGYYLAVGTDFILTGPSSPVGNIGVISELPPPPIVFEDLATTGPYKLYGSPPDTRLRRMESIKQGFLQAVELGRGERLNIGPQHLLSGEIWLGTEAMGLGLVDQVGSMQDAVEQAARMARIANYRVENLRELAGLPEVQVFPFFYESPEGVLTSYPREPGLYLLYIPPFMEVGP